MNSAQELLGYGPMFPTTSAGMGSPFAQAKTPGKPKPSIWSDPNLLAIMLGTMGQAVMGEHQQSWQAQMGRGAAGLGQSFKMADIAARREAERKKESEFWRALVKRVIEPSSLEERETMSIEGLEGAPYTYTR